MIRLPGFPPDSIFPHQYDGFISCITTAFYPASFWLFYRLRLQATKNRMRIKIVRPLLRSRMRVVASKLERVNIGALDGDKEGDKVWLCPTAPANLDKPAIRSGDKCVGHSLGQSVKFGIIHH